MKILKKQNDKETQITVCPYCESVLEFNHEDLHYDDCNDALYVICGVCKDKIPVEYNGKITVDNFKFPIDFYNCSEEFNAINISDEKINNIIRDCIKKIIREDNDIDNTFAYSLTGNTMICVLKDIAEKYYHVIVCKNFFEGYIDID